MKLNVDAKLRGWLLALGICAIVWIVLAGLLVGCVGPGIQAGEISGLVQAITDRHDGYVLQDPTLSPARQETYLRSSDLLRRVLAEAQRPGGPR